MEFFDNFGKPTKLIGTVSMTFVMYSENTQTIFLKIASHLVSAWYFRCYETMNIGLLSKLLVLYVYIWLISAWDSRGNEKSQLRSVSKITQGCWFSFQFLLFLWFSCNSFYLTPLNWRNKFMHVASLRIIFLEEESTWHMALKHEHSSWMKSVSQNENCDINTSLSQIKLKQYILKIDVGC